MIKQLRPAFSLLALMTLLLGLAYPASVWLVGNLLFSHQATGSLLYNKGRVVGSELIGQPFSAPRYFWPRPSATSGAPYQFLSSGGSNMNPANPELIKSVQERVQRIRNSDNITPKDLACDHGASALKSSPLEGEDLGEGEETIKNSSDPHAPSPIINAYGIDPVKGRGTLPQTHSKNLPSLCKMSIPADLVTASGSGLDPHISPEAASLQASRIAHERGLETSAVEDLIHRTTEERTLGFLGQRRVNVLQLNLLLDRLKAEAP